MRRIVCVLVLLGYAVLTHQRATDYQSELAIWKSATRATPTFRAWINYRNALMNAGRLDDAILACGPLSRLVSLKIEHAMLSRACLSVPP